MDQADDTHDNIGCGCDKCTHMGHVMLHCLQATELRTYMCSFEWSVCDINEETTIVEVRPTFFSDRFDSSMHIDIRAKCCALNPPLHCVNK